MLEPSISSGSSKFDFEEAIAHLHKQIVAESVTDVYSGHTRCEKISVISGVVYYNDSLSVNLSDAAEGLKFIPESKVIWIMNESDEVEGLFKLNKIISEKIIGIIVIGDHNNRTMIKLLDYTGIVISAASTTEAAELSLFFKSAAKAVIFCPASTICPKLERNQDQGHLFKKAVKTMERNSI